jgi:hypothetical protein
MQPTHLGSVWLRSQIERSRSIPDSRNEAALFCVWQSGTERLYFLFGCRVNGMEHDCESEMGTERLRSVDFFLSGMIPDLRRIFPNWSHSILVTL